MTEKEAALPLVLDRDVDILAAFLSVLTVVVAEDVTTIRAAMRSVVEADLSCSFFRMVFISESADRTCSASVAAAARRRWALFPCAVAVVSATVMWARSSERMFLN